MRRHDSATARSAIREAGLVACLLASAACARGPAAASDALTIAVPFELDTLDPQARDKLSSAALLSNVYEALVAADREMRIGPALASTWESPDPLTWLLHLRSGVRFHGGRELRADDVVFSYERLLQAKDLALRAYLLDVREVDALDPLTVRVRTRHPARILLSKLSHVPIVPVGSTASALAAATDGTGPYAVASWVPGSSLQLRRNEDYWGPRPQMRTVEFVLGQSADDALAGLLAGRYQFVRADSKRVAAAVSGSDRFRLLRQQNLFVKYFGFDLAHPPFEDTRVRQAIDVGVDRERLVRGLGNDATPATQPVPRFVFGYAPDIPPPVHDTSRARALLAEAGVGAGLRSVLHTRRILGEAASLVAADLEQIGIHLEVKVLEDSEFFSLLERRGAAIWLNAAGCSTGDASDLFDALVHSVGMQNFSGFSDPELDRAIEHSAAVERPEVRRNALQEIMAAAMNRLVVVPLYGDQDVYAIDARLDWSPRSDSYILAADVAARR